MKIETNGWGDSMVATKYMHERISDILNKQTKDQICYHLSRLSDELAHNYKIDTNKSIGEVE
tara:strand:- start:550 stop:735 length:186 start_codon:yes stop_codon:yes gene_type:complete